MRADLEKVWFLIKPILEPLGYELIEIRFLPEGGRSILRVRVDREGGMTVGDCERVSREIETVLEVEGTVAGRYDLEVSSPGLDRPLVKESDFARFAGSRAAIRTREPIDGRRNYKGLLKGMVDRKIVIEVEGKRFDIPFEGIEKAHLIFY